MDFVCDNCGRQVKGLREWYNEETDHAIWACDECSFVTSVVRDIEELTRTE